MTGTTVTETDDDRHANPSPIRLAVPTGRDMQALGRAIAGVVRGGDVLGLDGPLGAGKTTLAQGIGQGLGVREPLVSPTFTIARELDGRLADGEPIHLVHVDAYRLGAPGYQPGQEAVDALLDDLESLGLDEELEEPGENTVILMEWGQQMVAALAGQRLEVRIERPPEPAAADSRAAADRSPMQTLTSAGVREVSLTGVGGAWQDRNATLRRAVASWTMERSGRHGK